MFTGDILPHGHGKPGAHVMVLRNGNASSGWGVRRGPCRRAKTTTSISDLRRGLLRLLTCRRLTTSREARSSDPARNMDPLAPLSSLNAIAVHRDRIDSSSPEDTMAEAHR
jgi:hypothetical protein